VASKKLAEPKDAYSFIAEETKKIVDASVTSHFHPPPPPLKHVVPEDVVKFFTKMAKVKQMGAASRKLSTDYERIARSRPRASQAESLRMLQALQTS
jgi:hypothetical protein